ncbi:MAG TPA: 16S rRNA (guanine(966)-N(2))-methyltransferase RsmD [Pseudomonadales bacterium]|nr:16S rRNA (guanine(966)-N(2))-methyltransferase RsmD [Pseudomonadales bacterium]
MQRRSRSGQPASGKEANRVRIIGGRWRGRKLAFPDVEGLRPTGDRIRETLFNWLAPVLPGGRCLDLFAGSGALGFEALSRGASLCVMVERNPVAVHCLQDSRQQLGADTSSIVAMDARNWLAQATGTFDLVFLDPPFADTGLSPHLLVEQLSAAGLLAGDAWIYVEQPADSPAMLPSGFALHRSQQAGKVSYGLWRRT